MQNAQESAQRALTNAKGFEAEIKLRQSGGKPQIKMGDEGLQHAFNSAKSTLRINVDFLRRQSEQQSMLNRRCDILKEVGAATAEKLEEMNLQLERAKEDWSLALQTMNAMQASDDIVRSPDAATYHEALDGITKEAEFFNGRVLMLMDHLDPTVQSYRMDQAGNQIADEQCYQAFLQDTKVTVKPEAKPKLLEAPQQPVLLADAERLLGNVVPTRETVAAQRTANSGSAPQGTAFGDLLHRHDK